MSDEVYIKLVGSCLKEASVACKRPDVDAARYYLAQAADAANYIEDDRSRRFAWSRVAKSAVSVQYPELSQQLARKLIRLDRKLGCTPWIITDLLSYGSSLLHSGQHLEAEDVYRQAYDLALEIESWQRAAAASANYAAAIAARGGDLQDAQNWIMRALKYLSQEPDLDTEIRAQAMLIQVKHARGEPPNECLKEARSIVDEYDGELTASHRAVLQATLEPVLSSYFAGRTDLSPPEWVQEHFPELIEETDG